MSREPVLRSRRNPRVVAAASLHERAARRTTGRTLLEGPRVVGEALAAGVTFEVLFVGVDAEVPAAAGGSTQVIRVDDSVLEKLAGTRTPTGPIGVVEIPPSEPLTGHRTVVLCGVSDPGNAGTLIRSAAAFGYRVAVTAGSVDPWSPKVLRAGAGGHFWTQITLLDSPLRDELERAGLNGVALVAHGGAPAGSPVPGIPALLVGSEAHGLGAEALAAATHRVTIPMDTTESLNAAVAGAIAMYLYR